MLHTGTGLTFFLSFDVFSTIPDQGYIIFTFSFFTSMFRLNLFVSFCSTSGFISFSLDFYHRLVSILFSLN